MRREGAVIIDGLTTGMDLVAFSPMARASVCEFKYVFDAHLKNRGPDTPVPVAYAYEQATHHRLMPTMTPSLEGEVFRYRPR